MATTSAESLNSQYETRDIAIELIDEPERPERETMDERELAELAMNIAEVGLIKPLVVKPKGERFEVVAGHRRLMACRIVDYTPVPCRVKVNGEVDPIAILVSENAHTEAVNPVEEARFYQGLLTQRCGNDIDALCIAVRRRREYVEDRLLLLLGYPQVIKALQHKRISFAVARELNKVRDPNRLLLLLDTACNQGASARQVAQWRTEANRMGPVFGPEDLNATNAQITGPVVEPFVMRCLFCESAEDPSMMEMVYLHKPCKRIVKNMLGREQSEA